MEQEVQIYIDMAGMAWEVCEHQKLHPLGCHELSHLNKGGGMDKLEKEHAQECDGCCALGG